MAQNIPFEILAQILSSFKEDKSMLSSSSMVSRMWLDVARPFLFASITLRSPGDITGSAKASLSHTALNDFIDRYPQLARSVKELFFRYISKPLNMADVSATLARLPRLRSIFLDRLKFADSPQATRPMPIRLACIQASDLCSIKGHPHPLFILCKYLTADRFIWDHSDLNLKEQTADDFPETLDRQPMTDLVMTTTATGEPDFAFFSLYVAPRTLRVLTVNLIAWVGAQSMCRFIDEAGQRLVCLQIELIWLLEYDQSDRSSIFRAHLSKHRTTAAHLFSVFPDPDSPLLGRSISKLTRLETLHIRVPACRSMCSWMRDDFPLRYAVFPAIFEPKCPPSPRLRVLSIHFVEQEQMFPDKDAVEMWGIDALNLWAAPERCPGLDHVEVQIEVQSGNEDEGWDNVDPVEVCRAVKGALPDLAQAGRLRIVGLGHAEKCARRYVV